MDVCFVCVFFPDFKVWCDVDTFKSVPGGNVVFSYCIVIFWWVTSCNNYPASWNFVFTEYFVLQKLKHNRCQCFRYTVDFVQKQDTFFKACCFHQFVNRSNNFRKCVFRNCVFLTIESFLFNKRQTDSRLTCVVCHRVRQQAYTHF